MAEGVGSGDLRILSLLFTDTVGVCFFLSVSSNRDPRPARSRPARRPRVEGGGSFRAKSVDRSLPRPQVEQLERLWILFTSDERLERLIDRRIVAAPPMLCCSQAGRRGSQFVSSRFQAPYLLVMATKKDLKHKLLELVSCEVRLGSASGRG